MTSEWIVIARSLLFAHDTFREAPSLGRNLSAGHALVALLACNGFADTMSSP